MSKQTGNGRAALLGVLFAMVGFSYAIATTSGVSESGPGVAARAFSTNPLHFTNPLVSGDRDLGDILGSGVGFVRWAHAAGGVPPYKFVSTQGKPTSPLVALSKLNPSILIGDVFLKGEVFGTIAPQKFLPAGPVRFQIELTDSSSSNNGAGNTVIEFFRLTVVNTTQFRFAADSVPDAVQFRPYQTSVPVLNGVGTKTFTVTNIKVNGNAKTSFETDVGLSISKGDGTIFGKPIVSGTVTFNVNATDSTNKSALSRSGAIGGQPITLTIADNNVVSSDVLATAISVKFDTAVGGKDSISYSGIASLNGQSVSKLGGSQVTLRIAGYTTPNTPATPATLDLKGKIVKVDAAAKNKNAPTLKAGISAKSVKVQVGKESFGKNGFIGTVTPNGVALAVSLQVGSAIIGTEVLNFDVKIKDTKVQLTYKLGKNVATGGNFLVTTVSGKDDTKATNNQVFDSWKVGFVGQAPAGGNIDAAKSAEVEIGRTFADATGLGDVKNGKVSSNVKPASPDGKVTKFSFDNTKGKGSVTTGFIAGNSASAAAFPSGVTGFTGLPSAAAAGDGTSVNFALNVTLFKVAAAATMPKPTFGSAGNAVFAGEAGQTIFAKKTSWSDKNPVK